MHTVLAAKPSSSISPDALVVLGGGLTETAGVPLWGQRRLNTAYNLYNEHGVLSCHLPASASTATKNWTVTLWFKVEQSATCTFSVNRHHVPEPCVLITQDKGVLHVLSCFI